ncbi:DUF2515 family protein [Herbaspirillum rubrisubalbicans]|uniref:DUF2515 family protein n=1 Tax=Herbaspirillum rubrisubalbicans TaxID=80842 RepID=UPI0015C53643|nr:hypothetical protein [Herbaspirillum rubrisubalbicans]NQE49183.1 hypothetical protein [Herbaspirillum rubrisubalbicans]
MGDLVKTVAPTNTTEKSFTEVACDCNDMWSIVQQFSTIRLCEQKGKGSGKILQAYSTRAKRIAATYARFYLETEDGGNADFKGRHYWMALGAFASKTVACSLDMLRVEMLQTVFQGLGKGNLWLFYDISGWHYYYNKYRQSFDLCINQRNAAKYLQPVQEQMNFYPWKDEALPKIKNMSDCAYIKVAFQKTSEFEGQKNVSKRPPIQMANLLAIADHEQGVILQPLIYEDPDFAKWVRRQRWMLIQWASPDLQLVFNHACDTKNVLLKSVAPDDTVLENLKSRMFWISAAASKFHHLMQTQTAYMEKELHAIADWVNLSDDGLEIEPAYMQPF